MAQTTKRKHRDPISLLRFFNVRDMTTVFIRISAQPRISAHLEQAPILKAEKFNKRPASNKHPPPLHLPPHQTQTQTQISGHSPSGPSHPKNLK